MNILKNDATQSRERGDVVDRSAGGHARFDAATRLMLAALLTAGLAALPHSARGGVGHL